MPVMKEFSLSLGATLNTGNYENIRPEASAVFTPVEGESLEEAASAAVKQVHQLFAESARDLLGAVGVSDWKRRELLAQVGIVEHAAPPVVQQFAKVEPDDEPFGYEDEDDLGDEDNSDDEDDFENREDDEPSEDDLSDADDSDDAAPAVEDRWNELYPGKVDQ